MPLIDKLTGFDETVFAVSLCIISTSATVNFDDFFYSVMVVSQTPYSWDISQLSCHGRPAPRPIAPVLS